MRKDAIPRETVDRFWKMYQQGKSLTEIGKLRGTTSTAVGHMFRTRGYLTGRVRTCVLPECQKEFITDQDSQVTCCRTHRKRYDARRENGVQAGMFPCAMPECTNKVLMVFKGHRPSMEAKLRGSKKYCSHSHCVIMDGRRSKDWFVRLLKNDRRCIAPKCKERIVLDEHHTVFGANGSDKTSQTCWLCPTHHMAIHRGYAWIENGKYRDMVPTILAAIRTKRKVFETYDSVLFSSKRVQLGSSEGIA